MKLDLEKFTIKEIAPSIFTTNFQNMVLRKNNLVDCLANLPKRFIFYDGRSLPLGFFFTYYGFIHNRKYANPHINDLLLVHEFSHFSRFAKKPSKNYVDWSDKMIEDEYEASLDSEMLIYFSCNEYREHTFNHPILYDKLDIKYKVGYGYDIAKKYRKLRDKAIYKPKGFVEEQIANYQKSNRHWCSLYATTYKKLEIFNINIFRMINNPNIADSRVMDYFLANIQDIVDYTIEPIMKFEEYYKEVNKTYGNQLYDL